MNFCTIEKKVSSGSISQLEKPTYSSVTKKKKRKGKKKRRKRNISEDSVDSLSEYESEYEHVEVEQEPLQDKEESKTKENKDEEKLLNDIEQELNNILGDKESVEESDKESGDFKEISITLGKKKRRRRRRKKKKKVAFKEAEDEILKDFAFRTEK